MACDKVYRFRINESLAKAEFVELVLNMPKMVEEIDTLKTGTSDSGVNLTQEKFLALEFQYLRSLNNRKSCGEWRDCLR